MLGPVILIISTSSCRTEKRIEGAQLGSYAIGRGTDAALFLNDSGISRHHCRLYASDSAVLIEDTGSSGGTWLNGERLAAPARLRDGDEVQIGGVRIEVRLESERVAAAAEATMAAAPPMRRHISSRRSPEVVNPDATLVAPAHGGSDGAGFGVGELLVSDQNLPLDEQITVALDREALVIGRDSTCDLPLNNLMISRRHACIRRVGSEFAAEDLGSTNGTYLNEQRLMEPRQLSVGDSLKIGPYCLMFDGERLVSERPETGAEISIRGLCKEVTDRETGRPKMLLRDISFTIRPRHFVGLLGTSGAGKSTFVGAISGRRPATHGEVLLNGENLYASFEALKAGIGFVPQDVIFHDSLPLIEALRYTSRLRLSKDASDEEIEANLERVLKTVGLTENRATIIRNLSGGQKKRVSIAMELLSQPRILFLDEVTSGLDPHTEKQMMKLFRELADSGITVICITHHANSVEICDEIVYLNKGLLTFYGSPTQYKVYFGVDQIEAAYDKEEQKKPAQWQADFQKSDLYQQLIASGDAQGDGQHTARRAVRSEHAIDWSQFRRQFSVFTRRYIRILSIDRRNLLLLLGLPPLTAALLCILSSSMEIPPRVVDKATYGIWLHKQNILCFGPIISMFLLSMFGSVREIVKELSIYEHERFINLRIVPYLLSKVLPLAVIGAIQTASVVAIINCFADMNAGNVVAQFVPLFLISLCGMLAGLAISASVRSSDWAVMLMIGLVIPQLLFAGAMVPVRGASAFIAKGFISGYWALEALRTLVENYFSSHDLGPYVLPERSQGWGFGISVLLLHVVVFALLTFVLMARKDGRGTWRRIKRSLMLLFDDLRARWAAKWGGTTLTAASSHGTRLGNSDRARNAAEPSPISRHFDRSQDRDGVARSQDHVSDLPVPRRADARANMSRGICVFVGAVIGFVAGYPLSYFFQPGVIRAKLSLGDYIAHIGDVLNDSHFASTAIGTWAISVVGFALLGLLLSVAVNSGRDRTL